MCARDSKRTERRANRASSVVGSKLSEVTSHLPGRSYLRSSRRDQEGLKLIEGTLGDVVSGGDSNESFARRALRIVAMVSGGLVVLLVSVAIALAILSTTSAFEVTNVIAEDTEHVKADAIVQLANVEDGATLLNLDAAAIEQNVQRNPWVASVEVQKVFPDTINLKVKERRPGSVVAMGSGGLAWLMGDDQVWIEPIRLDVDKNESANDEALKQATELGVVLITDVPSSVQPAAGSPSTDKSILAVFSIMWQLTFDFRDSVACYSASSEDDISCILDNGVEVSMGSDRNVSNKEAVAKRILDEYAGQVTYINVRVPTRPSYRRVESKYVKEGSGAAGDATNNEPVITKPKKTSNKTSKDAQPQDEDGSYESDDSYDESSYDDEYYEDFVSDDYSDYEYGASSYDEEYSEDY